MIPSVATIGAIRGITRTQAVAIRQAMHVYTMHKGGYTNMCPGTLTTKWGVLDRISDILNAHGVEYIPEGKGKRSPSITYVNMGDTYDTTILVVNGRFRVGCWGDIVERGNYE